MQLFLSFGAQYLKDLLYDPSGQYGCPDTDGAAMRYGLENVPAGLPAGTVAVCLKQVALHVAYVHPVQPYIPKSISIKINPIQVHTRTLRSRSVQETFVVPPSTRSVLIFTRQDIRHLCADRELDGAAKAGAGVNAMGKTDTAARLADGSGGKGNFIYFFFFT